MIRLTRSPLAGLLEEAPPRVLVAPRGSRANSWEDVADLSARAGVVLDPWQERILEASMGERSDATWSAKRVGVSVPRQNGKSQLLVARALAGVLLFEEKKIVISAHQQDTARETFAKMVEILEADGNGWLMDRVRPGGILNAINREAVRFRNGSTVQFKARSGSGGRGFSSDCLMLDEAQRLKRPAWVSINSTMSAMPNPQVWLLGTPPTREDREAQMGEVFESVRSAARDGSSTATAWAEWGVDPDDPVFKREMAAATRAWSEDVERLCWASNPAWNVRMNREVVQGEHESYTAEEVAQDRLGVWLDDIGGSGTRAISAEQWEALEGVPAADGAPAYGVAFSFDGDRVGLAGGSRAPDSDVVHVELLDEPMDGSDESNLTALADWFVEKNEAGVPRWKRASMIVLAGSAGAGVLRQLLIDRKVFPRRITVASTSQYLQACEMTRTAVADRTLTHRASGQKLLDDSVSVSDRDKRGGWKATTPDGDEIPLSAVSLALWAARTFKARKKDSERTVVVL